MYVYVYIHMYIYIDRSYSCWFLLLSLVALMSCQDHKHWLLHVASVVSMSSVRESREPWQPFKSEANTTTTMLHY